MATNTQISDRSNKRFNLKGKTSDSRAFFEEPYPTVERINPEHIWVQRDLIPSTPSGFTPTDGEEVGVVRYNDVTLTLVTGTTKAFYNALLADIIPFDYGDGTSYDWTLTHSVDGTIVKGQGDWEVIDSVLLFNGTLPFSGGTLTMSFYSYIGQKADKYKGYYADTTALTNNYANTIGTPSDRAGWFCIVGSVVYTWSVANNQWEAVTSDLVDDASPQLGADLDLNNNDVTGTGNIDIVGDITTSGEFIGDLNGSVFVQVYNSTASTINKGDAVYLTGGNNGDKPHVDLADSSDVNKMPALGIVKENINPSSDGEVVVSGKINFNSHGFTAGANLFINGLGALQETAPTGEGSLIQKIGKVVSPNIILVQGAFRSNATPNLDDGNIFIGDASNQASTTPFAISLDSTPQLSGDLDLNGNGITYASGITVTDTLDEDDMSSNSATAVPTQQSTKAYVDNGDNKISQTFTNIADTNFTIDFNSEDFTINRHITAITADRTCTVSNAVNGSQFVIDVSIASGEVDHELIFSGPSSPTIIPDYINGTSNGVAFPGNASAATKYTVIGWYNGTEWRINVIDWN